MDTIGIDIGYSAVKLVTANQQVQIPSIVGTPEQSTFKFGGRDTAFTITIGDRAYNIGEQAIEQSRFTVRQESRDWYRSVEYLALLHAALSSIYTEGHHEIVCVTGLPVAFYEDDQAEVKTLFEKVHPIRRDQNSVMPINIRQCFVIPQVMGTLLNEALSQDGLIQNRMTAEGRIGVIDIGGNTTNFLHAHKMGDVKRETTSINLGGWNAMRAVRPVIDNRCPDVDYSDHEISQIIADGEVRYKGKMLDLSSEIADVLDPMAEQLIAKAKELWPGGGARLDQILLSGGGSLMLGERIMARLDHSEMRVVEDSVFANASGYFKLAKYRQTLLKE